MRESDLGAPSFSLYDGEHGIVAGPARSGKSLALWTIASSLAGQARVVAVAGRRSPLRECPAVERVVATGAEATALPATDEPLIVLIDDAEAVEEVDGLLNRPGVHIVAAARADALRSLYGHWTQEVRRSRVGVLLRPDIDLDGDLVGVTLPRRAPVQMVTGGELEIVQVALPDTRASLGTT